MTSNERPSFSVARRTALGFSLATVLNACARIPTTSSIRSVAVDSTESVQATRRAVEPPREGASPTEIVVGFINAHSEPRDDFAIARSYLTGHARKTWTPSSVSAYEPGVVPRFVEGNGLIVAEVTVTTEVSSDGIREDLANPRKIQAQFSVTNSSGQWRIDTAPAGLILTMPDFLKMYQYAVVYFLDASRSTLIGDSRWYPAQQALGRAFNQFTLGPKPYLDGAVTSEIPRGVTVPIEAAQRDSRGTVHVDVPREIALLGPDQRTKALAQLHATVQSVSKNGSVVFTSGPDELTLTARAQPHRSAVGSQLIGAGHTGIVAVDPDRVGMQLVPAWSSTPMRFPSLDPTGSYVSAASANLKRLHIARMGADRESRSQDFGAEIASPAMDRYGYAWTALSAAATTVTAISGNFKGDDLHAQAAWIGEGRVRALTLSSDATRLVLIVEQRGASRLLVTSIVRDAAGKPRRLTEPMFRSVPLNQVEGVAWYSELSVILWGRVPGSTRAAAMKWDMRTGFESVPAMRESAQSFAGSESSKVLVLSTRDGALESLEDSRWVPIPGYALDVASY